MRLYEYKSIGTGIEMVSQKTIIVITLVVFSKVVSVNHHPGFYWAHAHHHLGNCPCDRHHSHHHGHHCTYHTVWQSWFSTHTNTLIMQSSSISPCILYLSDSNHSSQNIICCWKIYCKWQSLDHVIQIKHTTWFRKMCTSWIKRHSAIHTKYEVLTHDHKRVLWVLISQPS